MDRQEIKKELLLKCKNEVENKLLTIEKIMQSNKIALNSETKSSAGDKHETGRAMLQLEMEKASQQFESANKMQQVLKRVSTGLSFDIISVGCVIITSLEKYFLSVSLGEIQVEGQKYYAISPKSPIGNLLLGKRVGDEIVFNGKVIKILDIF